MKFAARKRKLQQQPVSWPWHQASYKKNYIKVAAVCQAEECL
jgi:hypothetical protein